MPRVEIPGVGIVNFPDNMPHDEIMSRAESMQSNANAPLLNPKDLPAWDLLKGGASRGLEGLKGTAFDLIPALAGSALGFKPYAKEQLQEYKERMAAEEAIHPTAYKGFEDIKGVGDVGGFLAETTGELAPDIASFLLGTGVGTTVGKRLATKGAQQAIEKRAAGLVAKEGLEGEAAKKAAEDLASRAIGMGVKENAAARGADIGGKIGLFGTSMAQSIPETFNNIYEETQDLSPGIALTLGTLKGALDTYLPGKILKQLGPSGKDRLAAAMLEKSTVVPTPWKRAFIGEAVKTVSGEAATESAQQAIDVLAAQLAGSKDPFFSQKNIDSILWSGLKGAVGGGTFGAPGAAIEARRSEQAATQEIAQRQVLEQQAAEKARQEKEQADQQELARQQQATGDLFGQEVPQGPVRPSTTVAERERAADPVGAMIGDLVQQFQATKNPTEQAAIAEKLKRIEDSLPSQSHEKQMLLDLLGPLLGYTPGKAYPTQSIDTSPITVDQQGVARTAQQAEAERTTPQQVEGYQPDLFPQELGLAQAQERAQGLPSTTEQALAGPPTGPLASREFTTSGLTPDVAQAQFKTKLDAPSLQGTGLKPQSGFFKKLLNKDLSDPADQAAVRDILVQVRQNPNIADSTKKAVESLAMQAFAALSQQTRVVGPQGGIRRDVNYGSTRFGSPAVTADRTSVQVPSEQVSEPTQGVGELEQQGLGPTGGITSESGNGEAVQPDTLTKEEQDALNAELAATQVEGKPTGEESTATGTTEGAGEVGDLARTESTAEAAPTEEVAPEVVPQATERVLTKPERKFLEDHVLNLKAERNYVKDPEARAAIDAEIAATNAQLKEGKYQVIEPEQKPFTGDVAKLAKDLRAALDRMGLHSVALKLEQEIKREYKGKVTSHRGEYRPFERLISLSLKAGPDFFTTLNHEAIHAMRDMGIFSYGDWKILSGMAKNKWIKQYDIEKRWGDTSAVADPEGIAEEAVAEAFRHYQDQTPHVQSILEKAINTLRRIGNWVRGYGYKTSEDIFGKAASGQLAKDRAAVIERFEKYADTRISSEVKYQVAEQSEVFTGMDKVIRDIPKLSDSQKAAVSEGVKRAGGAAKSGILSMLPMHALGEVADAVFPGLGTKFNRLINERSGYQDKLNRGTDAVIEEAKKAIKEKPEQRDAYNKLVNTTTVEEVDPTKSRSEYLKDPEKLAKYDELVREYNKLDKVWKELYVTMRDGYKQMYEEVKKAITTRIDDTDLDEGTKKSVKDSVLAKLAEKGMIEPYFGLGREGSYWLAADYKDKSGQQQTTVEAFKSEYERKVRMEQLQKMGASRVEPYANIAEVNYRRAPTGSFVNSVLNILETNKPKEGPAAARFEKAIDEMMRLFLTTLPETAFAQSFQKRKGTAGYMEDTVGVFERKMRNTAHQVANMVYNPKLTGAVDAMREKTVEAGKTGKDNQLEKSYLGEFEKHLNYVLSPTKNDIGSILTSAAFTYTLGFNLSSALVNMANVPMIVAPYLKGKYADSNVARAIGDATKLFTGSGLKTNMPVIGANGRTTGMRVMPSITNYAPDSEMGKRYATLIRIGNEQGQFNRSQLYEIINGDTRTGVMAKFNAMSGWMFHHGERMNREVTMVATYNLEMERLKKEGITGEQAEIQAANTAIYTNELTNGGISAAAAPRIAQNPIGKMFFMYKRYGVSMYYMMFKTAKEALKGETPEARKAAFRQLGGIVGMSALMAGAQGIPMFGALSLIYSLFTDDDEDDLDAVTQKALGDFLYKGPVEYATNLAIAGRITLNDLIIRDAPKGSASTFSQQVAQALGGPVLGVADRIQRGYSKMNEGNIERAMEDLLPSAIANGFKAYRYATEGTKTLRGDPITGEVSLYNSVGQLFGFAPADYTRQLEINAREKGIDKTISTQTSKQKQKYYIAKREGDVEGMNAAKEKLLEMGAKHPGLGITPGTVNTVIKNSVKAQERATKEMIHGARYNKKRLKEVQESMAEYED